MRTNRSDAHNPEFSNKAFLSTETVQHVQRRGREGKKDGEREERRREGKKEGEKERKKARRKERRREGKEEGEWDNKQGGAKEGIALGNNSTKSVLPFQSCEGETHGILAIAPETWFAAPYPLVRIVDTLSGVGQRLVVQDTVGERSFGKRQKQDNIKGHAVYITA